MSKGVCTTAKRREDNNKKISQAYATEKGDDEAGH